MTNFLKRSFPGRNFPPVIMQFLYLGISLTFCYLYYHKFLVDADFYSTKSSGGIYAVLNGSAFEMIQIRVLIPYAFYALKSFITLFHSIADRDVYFILAVVQCYFIILSFYFVLTAYFTDKTVNAWLAPVIIYPMAWNYIIMNGQFFFMDFGVLLAMTLGIYFIVSEQEKWLVVVFFVGLLNHPSAGYLIPTYLLYNYKKLLSPRVIVYTVLMSAIYIGTYSFLNHLYPKEEGYFLKYALDRNLSLFVTLPKTHIVRDFLFNFGGLHWLVLIMFLAGSWKKFRGSFLYIALILIPYQASVFVYFSIEEMRNYVAVIPYVTILAVLFLSTLQENFLPPSDKILWRPNKKQAD